VSSIRDREIDVVSLGSTLKVTGRIPVIGEPIKMTMNKSQTRLYVAEDMSDTVDVIDISSSSAKNGTSPILETINVVAPLSLLQAYPLVRQYRGANTNSVTLSPDETQLYVTNGNLNSIAVVQLSGTDKGDQVAGLIPTGWYPNSLSFGPTINSPNGNWVYVVNGKSPTGPNAGLCYSAGPPTHTNCFYAQQYNPQLIKAGFQSFPQPTTAQLSTLTAQVAINNHFSATESNSDAAVMAAVHQGIQHVIFIIKENRGYDQVLGDLEIGNGDPSLTEFGQAYTPNLHNLARNFVTLDNILASSETSTDGWPWTTSARAPDVVERQWPLAYAGRGLSDDSEGQNRNVNVAIPTLAGRMAANPLTAPDGNVLPGKADAAAPDGPDGPDRPDRSGDVEFRGEGYLWDAALRAHLTVRDYGFFVDTSNYPTIPPAGSNVTPVPLLTDPHATNTIVASSNSVSLAQLTDPYYRGFDNQFPDYYRFKEWEREFDANYATAGLPALTLVRLMHDHTGNFNDPGGFGLNTPELQQADNDYAVGLLVQKIANSVYKNNTLVFVIEDDSQDSGDHVDSHRTVAFVAGAYVKQKALISTQYNTINFVRTIEEVLGLPPMNLNDALSRPMADIFNTSPNSWSFAAAPSAYLYCSTLAPKLPTPPQACPKLAHAPQYWMRVTKGMDFTSQDRFDFSEYNRILWKGLMGNRPYPATPNGKDLRQNRENLLARYRRSVRQETAQAPKTRTD
jgi:DNA-binding beta-propeller fold protein YncE